VKLNVAPASQPDMAPQDRVRFMGDYSRQIESPEDVLVRKQQAANVRRGIATLKPRHQVVVTLHFGLDRRGQRSLEDVGKAVGVGVDRASQMIQEALRALRHPKRARLIRGEQRRCLQCHEVTNPITLDMLSGLCRRCHGGGVS
jgi:DNA-directed RNA polymerase sigma subunit (sigma70/sigma32)